ncbi:hypothetical protein, variant 1 [Aphanomyces astaci]|uniref:rRNA methyltransferase 1, mitochondrial n=1 Tax=Aphanomyces astaci TaxID=112090 RepID=W4H7S0_APHAT|nr:hypothetical protein, variant 1 [Aphanomyces astaci]ETV88050.1 hypothetical protein, variant 1 [Aphanomyces astaci]|eukprot:XP_009822913.1 hypothetical protein, variant 1 [Aphanomyces astaci]
MLRRGLQRTFATGSWSGGRSESSQSWRNSKPDSARSWKGRDASARTPSGDGFRRGGGGGDGFRRGGGGGRKSFGASSADGSGANVVPEEVIPGEALHGIHGVRQALRCNMRVFHKLMLRDTNGQTTSAAAASKKATPEIDRHLKEIKSLALEYGIPVTYESKWTLNHVTHDKPHQGVVLFADAVELPTFDPLVPPPTMDGRPPVILALDELHDAQNFGAVLRSAYFLGAHAVLTSARNNAPLSAAVLRASVGSSEVLAYERRLFETSNMHQALASCQQLGWTLVGACSGTKAVSSAAYEITSPTILVVGNEHRGLKSAIRRICDNVLTIPGSIQDEASKVDSLNVSAASAILLYQLLHGVASAPLKP